MLGNDVVALKSKKHNTNDKNIVTGNNIENEINGNNKKTHGKFMNHILLSYKTLFRYLIYQFLLYLQI